MPASELRSGRERVYHTDAIVLSRFNLGEADRILSVLTPSLGKLRVIAKGIRRPTSRFASHTELLSLTHLTLAKGRDLDVVAGAQLRSGHWLVRDDLDAMGSASHCAELIEQLLQERDSHPGLYRALRSALELLDSGANPLLIGRWFEFTILASVGFRPDLYRCVSCARDVEALPNPLSGRLGGMLCTNCRSADVRVPELSVAAQKLLRVLDREGITAALRLAIPPEVVAEMGDALQAFTQHHVERDMRSLRVMRRVNESLPAAVYDPS